MKQKIPTGQRAGQRTTPRRSSWERRVRRDKAAARALVAPLFAYCDEHGIRPLLLARRAAMRAGAAEMNKWRLSRIKLGQARTPDWFIAGMCREIGQPVEVVMGEEWAQKHMTQPTTHTTQTTQQPRKAS